MDSFESNKLADSKFKESKEQTLQIKMSFKSPKSFLKKIGSSIK